LTGVNPESRMRRRIASSPYIRLCEPAAATTFSSIMIVHPFGGFDMSGTDSKAGGRDYLGLFLQAKSISERLL